MKKLAWFAIFLLLVCLCADACAGGLNGLIGGQTSTKTGALPDPAEALSKDDYGKQTEKNYDFGGGYYCNVFAYPQPISKTKFIQDYTVLAKMAGYSVEETVLDGFAAYKVSNGDGKTAYLVPEAGTDMLFLVEIGMDFSPAPRKNYLRVERNGVQREYLVSHIGASGAGTPNAYGKGYYDLEFALNGDYRVSELLFHLPNGIEVGDSFYVTSSGGRVANLYFGEYANNTTLHYFLQGTSDYYNDLKGRKDYFLLTITGREETNFGERISGTFEGSFSYGEEVFKNGVFSIDCYDR